MYKMKKIINIFLGAFLAVSILSGCAETPDNVKQEIEEIEKARGEQRELENNLTYVRPSELRKDSKDKFAMDHGVLRFDGSVNIPDCNNVYLLEMKANDEIIENIDENMQLVLEHVGVQEKDWKKYITNENGIIGKADTTTNKSYNSGRYCSVEINDIIIFADQAGYFSINQKTDSEDHPYFLKNGKIIDTYFLVNDKENLLNSVIDLDGEEVTLGKLNDRFEKEVDLMNRCSPNLNLVTHDVRISEDRETKIKMAVFRALSSYKGVCFDSNYILTQEAKVLDGKSFVGFEMNQQIHNEGDTCATALRETSYIVSKEVKELDEVIDFESALNMIEHTVPNDKITTIESAEFMYQIYYEGEEGQRWENIREKPPVFYAYPVWKFVEKDRSDEYSATVYYVDAVSGKVHSFYKGCTP